MNRLFRLFQRTRLDEQLDKELRFHLDEHAADLAASGHAPEMARRAARLALGGQDQVKEASRDVRGTRWLDDALQDARYAWRALWQRPGFAAVTLCTLALGIGATTVMFTVLDGVLLKPLPYPDPERLVAVWVHTDKYGDQWGISYPNFLDTERQTRALAPLAAWTYGGGTIGEPGDTEYVDGRLISAQLFSVFKVTLFQGRPFLAEEDRPGGAPVAIISHELWQRRYGGRPSAIGLPLLFDGRPHTVVGVAPDGFQLDGNAGVYTPIGQNTDQMILVGAGVGLAIAFAVARVIERLVAGVRSAEPLTFSVMIAVLVSAGLVASALPARRAARIEPMRALRQE